MNGEKYLELVGNEIYLGDNWLNLIVFTYA